MWRQGWQGKPLHGGRSINSGIKKLAVVGNGNDVWIAPGVLLPDDLCGGRIEDRDGVPGGVRVRHGKIEQLVHGIEDNVFGCLAHDLYCETGSR